MQSGKNSLDLERSNWRVQLFKVSKLKENVLIWEIVEIFEKILENFVKIFKNFRKFGEI